MGIAKVTEVSLFVNGRKHRLVNPSPCLTLNEFLRTKIGLTGTKVMCNEGGCGCCVVAMAPMNPMEKPSSIRAINSCLCPVLSLDGCHIITVEGIGNQKDGYHKIQEQIVKNFGTQCGYCTPGFVMSGYSLLTSNPKRDKREIENAFDGNICRCTGYRPILDAMKSFADDPKLTDIEDFGQFKRMYCCPTDCSIKRQPADVCELTSSTDWKGDWYCPESENELMEVLKMSSSKNTRLVNGNTGSGLYKDDAPADVYVSLQKVKEFSQVEVAPDYLKVGANVTLSELMVLFEEHSEKSSFFPVLINHMKKISGPPVRNVGTWAGNLMLVHRNPSMPSDMFLLFESIDVKLDISSGDGVQRWYSLSDFLQLNMDRKIVRAVKIPYNQKGHIFSTYKVMPRSASSLAYMNAGFVASIDQNGVINEAPRLVFGAISERIVHASKTEKYLQGKCLWSPDTLKAAVDILNEELVPYTTQESTSDAFRKQAGIDCFYKFYLQLIGDKANLRFRSAAKEYIRPVSHGTQSFPTSPEKFPLTQPLPKLESKMQTSGEALYVNDIPEYRNQVYAAPVLAGVGNAIFNGVDITEAEKMQGYLAIVTYKDIPGDNISMFGFFYTKALELLVSTEILYAGQVVAMVVADTQQHANQIAKKVKVNYQDVKKPVLKLTEAIEKGMKFPETIPEAKFGDVEDGFKKSANIVTGEIESSSLHHFHIETQVCMVIPNQNVYTVYSASQSPALVQNVLSKVLNEKMSNIDVRIPRVGGGFGGKGMYSLFSAGLCGVAAAKMRRPVRLAMDFNTMMKFQGNRLPTLAKYKVGTDKDGMLQAIDVHVFLDDGAGAYTFDGLSIVNRVDNVYFCPNWKVKVTEYKTNTPPNTYLRAPGNSQAIFICETMIEHVADQLKIPVEMIRQKNFYKNGQKLPLSALPRNVTDCNIQDLWDELLDSSNFALRKLEVAEFNKENRWRKRGLSIGPIKWVLGYHGFYYTARVSVIYGDGTILLHHGAVDIGQGVNTRTAQVAAGTLDVPVDMITVQDTSTNSTTNSLITGGSIATELACIAVQKCCEIINERMKMVRQEFPDGKWSDWVQECEKRRIDLTASLMEVDMNKAAYIYDIYGVAAIEAEIDVLTGQFQFPRADLLLDLGQSINPAIDLGQTEGSFVMGLGQWLHELIKYDKETGVELTDSTWHYKPPLAKDIPIDFRVTFAKTGPNKKTTLGSKASGEPPMLLANFAFFALKNAIKAARQEGAGSENYFRADWPLTVDKAQELCQVNNSQLQF